MAMTISSDFKKTILLFICMLLTVSGLFRESVMSHTDETANSSSLLSVQGYFTPVEVPAVSVSSKVENITINHAHVQKPIFSRGRSSVFSIGYLCRLSAIFASCFLLSGSLSALSTGSGNYFKGIISYIQSQVGL